MKIEDNWQKFLDSCDEYYAAKGRAFIANLERAIELDKAMHVEQRKKFEEKARLLWEVLNEQRSSKNVT